jgi:hypothetical protein
VSCGSVVEAEKADRSLMALLSGKPLRNELPNSVRITIGDRSAIFSDSAAVESLNRVLGNGFVSTSDPAMRPHMERRRSVGQLAVTVGGVSMSYELGQSITDRNLYVLFVPDRHGPGTGLLFFRDDASFTTILNEHGGE